MEANVAIFNTHKEAVEAVKTLSENSFNVKNVSIIGKAEMVDEHLHIGNIDGVEKSTVLVGTTAGTVVGLLTGLSLFAIPGLGFLYGAGAIVGALAGFDFGLVGSGAIALLTGIGADAKHHEKYTKHLNDGKYMLTIKGTEEEIKKAKGIFHTKGMTINWD